MTNPYWIDAPSSLADADSPLHAGITVDLFRGNLLRLLQESAYRVQSWRHDGSDIKHSLSAANTYEDMTPELGGLPIPMRRQITGSGWRGIAVRAEGKLSASATATIRMYLLPYWRPTLEPVASDGLRGDYPYAAVTLASTSWTDLYWKIPTEDIEDEHVGREACLDAWTDGDPLIEMDTCSLQAIVTATAAVSVYLRGLRIEEVTV